ncbi:MAG: hypothetical protein EXQ98_03575 [Alphaproteobacteria bacterium]|nr:hypothetical protein [Alphaproteobacteria bacterium]
MTLKAFSILAFGLAAFGLSVVGPSSTQAREVISVHDDWTSYVDRENDLKVCYIASRPSKQEGTFKKRGEPYVMASRRGPDKDDEQVSVTAGYPYKDDGKVEVLIGSTQFNLFVKDQWAWAPNAAGDKELVAAMARGNNMVVKAESRVGTTSADTYSLKGFSAARKAIAEACS